MSLRVHEIPPEESDRLLPAFPDRTIFHTSSWLSAVHVAYGLTPFYVAVFQGEQPVGLWPCLEQHKGPFRILGSPLPGTSTAYLGPLFVDGADSAAAITASLSHSRFGRFTYFACRTMSLHQQADLTQVGFERILDFDTCLLDLSKSEDDLWAGLKSECRNRVRKARNSGLEVQIEKNGNFLDDFWRMSVEVFAKSHRKPTFTRSFLEKAWQNLAALDRVVVLSACLDGRRVGMLMLPRDDHTLYYWGGGSFVADGALAAGNLLHWEAIRQARSLGLRWYDFVSSKGSPGRFKRTFGPRTVNACIHWEQARPRAMRVAKGLYERYVRRRRRRDRREVIGV